MLIVEGSDNLGKTTICRRLVELANEMDPPKNPFDTSRYKYNHMTRPSEEFNFFTDYRPLMNIYGIQDRFHLSAIAYHDPVPFDQAKLKFIESWLYGLGSVIVIIFTLDEVNYRTKLSTSNKIEMFDINTMRKANDIYRGIASTTLHNKTIVSSDWSINVKLNEDGSFDGDPTDALLIRILESWFKRIELLKEVTTFGQEYGLKV